MKKLKLHIKLISDENIIDEFVMSCLNFKKNEIIYFENKKTKVIFNYEDNTLIRENNEMKIEFKFDVRHETTGTIYIKDINQKFNVFIKTIQINKSQNKITIKYTIENSYFEYEIMEW